MSQDNRNIWEPSQNYIPGRSDMDYVPLSKAKSDSFDIDVRRILALWPFILLFGLLGYAAGSIFLRYSTPVYTITTSISIEEKDEICEMCSA